MTGNMPYYLSASRRASSLKEAHRLAKPGESYVIRGAGSIFLLHIISPFRSGSEKPFKIWEGEAICKG